MKSVLMKVAVAGAVALPLIQVRADDDKKVDDKKDKRVEVKVQRLDGKDGNKANSIVILNEADEKSQEKRPYLGVLIEPVPPALSAHLPNLVSADQGLLVAEVRDDSPAAAAGLKAHDILVSYDDQKLNSGEQLTKLVRADKPGHEVTLGVVRGGKLEKIKVTIGEVEQGAFDLPGRGGRIVLDPRGRRKEAMRILKDLEGKGAPSGKAGAQVKSNFSSMRLESLDGDRFRAEIEYKNEQGDALNRSFEGTREEIRKQIEADEELPDAIRNQLLRSLDFGKSGKATFQFGMPRGAFWFDTESDEFPAFHWPGSKDFEQIMEQLSDQIDPELREKLKGAFRSIEEQPRKQPVPRNRSL